MRKILVLLTFSMGLFFALQAQDSLFIYKNREVVDRYAVVDIDSITFERVTTVAEPIFIDFAFKKDENPQLIEDRDCEIKKGDITVKLPLITRKLVAHFTTSLGNRVTVDGVLQKSGETLNDFSKPVTYNIETPSGESKSYTVEVEWKTGLPQISITTLNNEPIHSKKEYLRAYLVIDGRGFYENFIDSTRVKGRGNSTWGMPKKPYKLKLDKKENLFGFGKEKDWVLLANYLEPTHLLNLVALKAGRMIGVPFTHDAIPVDLTINGQYQGIYTLTEQNEIAKHRVDIDKKDGVLLEMDVYFDEDFKFRSPNYNLPVMVKEPDLNDYDEEKRKEMFNKIELDFYTLEDKLADSDFPNNGYKDLIDVESVVKYLIVYNITDNRELNHPKSTFIHKDKGEKYRMGPVWDFDWAYGFEGTGRHFSKYNKTLLGPIGNSSKGYKFFLRIMEDPEVRKLYKKEWANFKTNILPDLLKYIDDNMTNLMESQQKDNAIWNKSVEDYAGKIEEFKTWLKNRAEFIDSEVDKY